MWAPYWAHNEHYPWLLKATWGWHFFYPSFIVNPLCATSDLHTLCITQLLRVYMCMLCSSKNPMLEGFTIYLSMSFLFVASLNITTYCPLSYHTFLMADLSPTLRDGWSSHETLMEVVRMRGTWQPRTWKWKVSSCLQALGLWIWNNSGLQKYMMIGWIWEIPPLNGGHNC